MIISMCAVFTGFILDLIFGDPYWFPHPVRFIGCVIKKTENILRNIFGSSKKGMLIGGAVLVAAVIFISAGIPFLILVCCQKINPWLRFFAESIMCYELLAAKALKVESMKVYHALMFKDLSAARTAVSMIVGRDTENLDAAGVTRGAVETVAENTCDGETAPLFYMVIGGAVFGFIYKAVNTMDSMVGYKNEKYIYFGRTAARLDDLLNFIPSRISGILMIISAFFLKLSWKDAKRIFLRDRFKHASPNSAQTEAACAGALGIRLAGDAWYFGKLHKKEYIGDDLREISPMDIVLANKMMYMTSFLALILFLIIRMFFGA